MNTYKKNYLFNNWAYCDVVVDSNNEIIASAQPYYTDPDGYRTCDPGITGYEEDENGCDPEWVKNIAGCYVFENDQDDPAEFDTVEEAHEYMMEKYYCI